MKFLSLISAKNDDAPEVTEAPNIQTKAVSKFISPEKQNEDVEYITSLPESATKAVIPALLKNDETNEGFSLFFIFFLALEDSTEY